MKTKAAFSLSFLIGIVTILLSMNTPEITIGPHGGKIKNTRNYKIELKNDNSVFYAYLLSKKGIAIPNNGISCEIRFFFPDSTTLDFPLKPYQKEGFVMESSLLNYTSYIVNFNVLGKIETAKYGNENALVHRN